MKEGLVAPVWSDGGIVSVAPPTVTQFTPYWDERTYTVIFGLVHKYAAMLKPAKPDDPNAKPALPALTQVSGNKRGPGWCDE